MRLNLIPFYNYKSLAQELERCDVFLFFRQLKKKLQFSILANNIDHLAVIYYIKELICLKQSR